MDQDEMFPGNRIEREARVINSDDERYDRFVEGYFTFFGNQTKAAIFAGYSEATAYSQGSRLMRRPEIADRIAARSQELKLEYGVGRTLAELACIAYVDPRRLFHEDGRALRVHELDENTARAIESFDLDEFGRIAKVKFAKLGGVDRFMRYHGLMVDKKEHTMKISLEDLITGATEREPEMLDVVNE